MSTVVTRAITVQTNHWREGDRIRQAVSALDDALTNAPGIPRRISLVQVGERITFKVTVREDV